MLKDNANTNDAIRSMIQRSGHMVDIQNAALTHFDALVADATRYRLGRAIAIDPNQAVRQRMFDATEPINAEQYFPDPEHATNEQYDAFMDAMALAADGARNG